MTVTSLYSQHRRCKRNIQTPFQRSFFKISQKLGQVTAVSVDATGTLWVFHRAQFDFRNTRKISDNIILQVDQHTGSVISSIGGNLFVVPHGLYVDSENTIWVTDVALHQVFQLSREGNVIKRLGTERTPGKGPSHFNKPTSVVRDSTGKIYVSDGYGNRRVAVFDQDGNFLEEWEGEFNVPHSITVDEYDRFYVADRENHRIKTFEKSKAVETWQSKQKPSKNVWSNHLSAVSYNLHLGLLFVIDGPTVRILDRNGRDVANAIEVQNWPHDVVATKFENKLYIYVAELNGKTLTRFERPVTN